MKGFLGAIILGIVLLFGGCGAVICTEKIPAGYVGVVYNMNGGVNGEILSQGFHLVSPTKKVVEYSVGLEQSYLTASDKGDSPDDESFTASSSEGKALLIELTYSYQYNINTVTDVFTRFRGQSGKEVRDSFIKPNIVSWCKEVIARYPVSDILGAKRSEVNAALTDYLSNKFAPYGITISNVSLINIEVDADTQNAINQKIQAQQNAETQKIANQTNIDKAEADAKAKITAEKAEADAKLIQAQAEADAIKIQADAEAEANEKIRKSLSEEVLTKAYIDKWNGKLPTVSGSDNSLISIPSSVITEETN